MVLIVISVLVVLAVPSYQTIVHRSQAAEARALLEAIAQAQHEYYRDHGHYRPCAPSSTDVPAGGTTSFDRDADGWNELGVAIDGPVRYQYEVEADEDSFRVIARGDLDGDGATSRFTLDGTLTLATEDELE